MAAVGDAEPAADASAAVRPSGARKRRRVAFGSADQYQEMSRLGEGSFGAVVKVRNRDTGQEVAIKHLPSASHSSALREAFFLVDACASGGGGNPFVVACHGVVIDPTTSNLGLVMEYVGPSLSDVLRHYRAARGPPLDEATVRAAMWQLLTGASKMHDDAQIVHRDVKPQNILVGGDGHTVLKFCDFGLAMSTSPSSEPPSYDHVGTLWYQAPELLLEKDTYDARVDVWALGCVMAEMINAGRPLFRGSDDEGQLCAIFSVLGVPDDTTWPWFSSTPFATEVVKKLEDMQRRGSLLREVFPDTKISEEGFQVLSGLLTCNPEKRLTAAAALEHPWFAKVDALELPKEEAASFLPKRRRINALIRV